MAAFFSSFFALHCQLVFCSVSYASWFSCFVVVLGHSRLQNRHQMIHSHLFPLVDVQEGAVAKQLVAAVGALDRISVLTGVEI